VHYSFCFRLSIVCTMGWRSTCPGPLGEPVMGQRGWCWCWWWWWWCGGGGVSSAEVTAEAMDAAHTMANGICLPSLSHETRHTQGSITTWLWRAPFSRHTARTTSHRRLLWCGLWFCLERNSAGNLTEHCCLGAEEWATLLGPDRTGSNDTRNGVVPLELHNSWEYYRNHDWTECNIQITGADIFGYG